MLPSVAVQDRSQTMKKMVVVILCVLMPMAVLATDNSFGVTYDGGSLPDLKAGTDIQLYIDSSQIRLAQNMESRPPSRGSWNDITSIAHRTRARCAHGCTQKDIIVIPVSAVTDISYGQDVHRRVGAAIGLAVVTWGLGALMALTKSKKHFVGLVWANGEQKGGFAMQCDKKEYRGILMGLEGVTGKQAVNSEAMTVKN
jgi:hypothetical protein